ncbi:MAG: starch-binding protein [Bacteroidales bacterium]|nr:starch-binding protein [Bacteroidales bacterium]
MRKTLTRWLLAITMIAPATTAWGTDYGIPDEIQDGNILHCFDWKFSDIQASLEDIAKAGFGAVQVSPCQGNCSNNAEWFYAYMPYDFCFKANGSGSASELQSLCSAAANYNIKIIVDVVANHVNPASGYHDTWWDSNDRVRWYGQDIDYSNRYQITHNQLGAYGDVNSDLTEVQNRAKAYVEELKGYGVKGIRWDAAKHIGLPSESCNFWPTVTSVSGMYHYGEILDGAESSRNISLINEYCTYMSITDSDYSTGIREAVAGGGVPSGYGNFAALGGQDAKMVYWGESHDTYANDGGASKNISQAVIDRAWAIGACRNGATALYFSRPSATGNSDIKMGVKGSTHFTSKEIAAVNHLRNKAVGKADYYQASDGVAWITRKDVGCCIVVGGGYSKTVSLENTGVGGGYVPAGTYTDEVSGNTFTVTSSTISGTVGSTGIAVIYTDSVSSNPENPDDPTTSTLQFFGDLNGAGTWSTASLTDGSYTFTVTSTSYFTFTTDGTWTGAWRPSGSTDYLVDADGTYYKGSQTDHCWYITAAGTYKVTPNASAGSFTISGFSSTPVDPVDPTDSYYVYLKNTSNWSTPTVWAWNDSENCTAKGSWAGDTMTYDSSTSLWKWTAPDGKVPTYIIFSNNGESQTDDLSYVNKATYDCSGNIVSSETPVDPVDPTELVIYFDNSDSWTSSTPKVWAWNDSGNCVSGSWPGAEMTLLSGKVYKFTAFTGTPTGIIITKGNGDETKAGGGDLTFTNGATYYSDGSSAMVTHGGGDPSGDYPSMLYLIGNVNSWGTNTSIAATTAENGIFTWKAVNMPAASASDASSYFTFVTSQGADWDNYVNQTDRYGAASKDEPLTGSATIVLFPAGVNASSAYSWKVTPDQYDVTADLQNMKVTIVKSVSGVLSISSNDSNDNVEYFTLLGVRVSNPQAGQILIRRQGSKVSKIVY